MMLLIYHALSLGWIPSSPFHDAWFPDDEGTPWFESDEPRFSPIASDISGRSSPGSPFKAEAPSARPEAPEAHNAVYTIETVTIVTGINRRINLARLCDAKPDIFGVRSQGTCKTVAFRP